MVYIFRSRLASLIHNLSSRAPGKDEFKKEQTEPYKREKF